MNLEIATLPLTLCAVIIIACGIAVVHTLRGRIINAALATMLLLAGPIAAYGQDAVSATPSPEKLLREMSATLKDARSFRFHAEINFDNVLISGQKLQFAGAADVSVRRPDGIHVDYRDDLSVKRFWYDGKSGTLLNVAEEKYSSVDLPGDIDAAIDQLQERYALTLPLADLISSDLFAILEARAVAWGYIGVHDVEGTPSHHIAIVGENADLQLWIRKDGSPLPLKIVVTYKNVPQAPQYQAVLMDWEIGAKVSAASFEPVLPKGTERIEVLVAEGVQ